MHRQVWPLAGLIFLGGLIVVLPWPAQLVAVAVATMGVSQRLRR